MIDLRNNQLRSARTVAQLFLADTDTHHDGIEALALTQVEFDAVRRPSVTGWRHFLRLQGLEFAHTEFDLKTAARCWPGWHGRPTISSSCSQEFTPMLARHLSWRSPCFTGGCSTICRN